MQTETLEKIEIATMLLKALQNDVEKQVIVHCTIKRNPFMKWEFRIWPTIYLFPEKGMRKCQLIQHYNIAMYPDWQSITIESHQFTLIFQGLPKDCKVFDIIEIIPETGAFQALNIKRNNSDVYHVNF